MGMDWIALSELTKNVDEGIHEYSQIRRKNDTDFVWTFCETWKVEGLTLAPILHDTSLEWQSSHTCRIS